MKIEKIQQDLESIYRLETGPSIEQFILSKRQLQEILQEEESPSPQVLVLEESGEIRFGIYLGDQTLQRIERVGLRSCKLEDLCNAVEEISHFRYLAWSVQNKRPVSLLDVELQGEIDKFLLASLYFDGCQDLFIQMFEKVSYEEHLSEEGRARYEEANRLGGKFCRSLGEVFSDKTTHARILATLREFYRMNTQARLSKVELL